jgi:hypothetical protein
VKRLLQLLLLGFISILASIVTSNSAYATSYAIGDTGPAGGKIFITPSTVGNSTGKYFEVAPVDISASRLDWCNSTRQLISGTLHSEIGAGSTNTQAMLNWGCTSGAAVGVSQYSLGGKTDWFLPSLDEAAQLYATKSATGLFDGSPSLDNLDTHWTSTGNNATTSWVRYFTSNVVYTLDQVNGIGGFFVRAVRSFTPTQTDAEIAAEKATSDEAARKKAEILHAEQVQACRSKADTELLGKKEITEYRLMECEMPIAKQSSFYAALNEILAIDSSTTFIFTRYKINPTVTSVFDKYAFIEKITGPLPVKFYARQMVSFQLIPADTPQKTRIIAALASLPVESRRNMEEVNTFIAKELAVVNDRRARLAAHLSHHL